MPRPLIWTISKKYIAGTHIGDALRVCGELNRRGFMVTVDLLGENILNLKDADKYTAEYLALIKRFKEEKIDGNFSVKPSMFGLHLDLESCFKNLSLILERAIEYDTFIRIDMEDSTCTTDEIKLFRRLKPLYPNRVGLVLQAYLKRTSQDVRELMDLHQENNGLNIRLCKGIYVEDQAIAFKDFQVIRDRYLEDLDFLLRNEVYVGIATHDQYLINGALNLIKKYNIPPTKYEFQMLYGVTPLSGQKILSMGHRMRIYVPYGVEWLNYSIRRLNENPAIVNHIIKAIFIKQ
jgi:proline dehydrogenase